MNLILQNKRKTEGETNNDRKRHIVKKSMERLILNIVKFNWRYE